VYNKIVARLKLSLLLEPRAAKTSRLFGSSSHEPAWKLNPELFWNAGQVGYADPHCRSASKDTRSRLTISAGKGTLPINPNISLAAHPGPRRELRRSSCTFSRGQYALRLPSNFRQHTFLSILIHFYIFLYIFQTGRHLFLLAVCPHALKLSHMSRRARSDFSLLINVLTSSALTISLANAIRSIFINVRAGAALSTQNRSKLAAVFAAQNVQTQKVGAGVAPTSRWCNVG
jgi:hypothetical protein